jgi:hypothetical protein
MKSAMKRDYKYTYELALKGSDDGIFWTCPSSGILKITHFRNWMFPSSGGKMGSTYSDGSVRKS